jgi:hypothetical protein
MNSRHRFVVSAENGAFHAWQCKLFYYSSITRLQHQPIFIVHANGSAWHPDFRDLVRAGAIVRTAPSYVAANGIPSRNFPGTLLEAAPLLRSGELIVLCDPDMVFVSRLKLPTVLAASYYSYMNYDEPSIYAAARRLRLRKRTLHDRQHELVCGTPYIFPVEIARKFGFTWLQAFDSFPSENRDGDNIWLDLMYAFGLAALKLDLEVKMFDAVNVDSPPGCMLTRTIIHYGMGDTSWDKRWYRADDTIPKVWKPSFIPDEGTVLSELFSQIRNTPRFYQDIFSFHANGDGLER